MSAFGPKRTWALALHVSAFGGKADMTFRGSPLSWSLFGVKRTSLFATHMSAFDPKRTWRGYRNLRKIAHRSEPPGGDMQRRRGSGQLAIPARCRLHGLKKG